jgi:hypothetical protein
MSKSCRFVLKYSYLDKDSNFIIISFSPKMELGAYCVLVFDGSIDLYSRHEKLMLYHFLNWVGSPYKMPYLFFDLVKLSVQNTVPLFDF